jgi:hypothetical protein
MQLEYAYCADNSGWACNELARHLSTGDITNRDGELALAYFSRSCELRFQPACQNLLSRDGEFRGGDPRVIDLRILLREGGANLLETPEPELYARACQHEWTFACGRVARAP